ncbi:MAG: hypothetical protein IIT55_05055 [Bacteroidaceae bacterium]|jgi:hypothetical protein|nr:hypothetical protein [Bacteroidaceae bacterium]MBQ5461188.1 hypothetical protein [Bacteroidaceae bacterium]
MRQFLLLLAAMLLTGCSKDNDVTAQIMTQKLYITIDGKTLPVVLVDNAATQALVAALQEGDITYEAHDYGGFEKVGALGRSLPTSNTQITTQAGDVILYSGNQIVLFYGSNSWSYTRLGRMEYASQAELESFLKAGQGNVTVKLSLSSEETSIKSVRAISSTSADDYVTLSGVRTQNPSRGIYIKDGKKIMK